MDDGRPPGEDGAGAEEAADHGAVAGGGHRAQEPEARDARGRRGPREGRDAGRRGKVAASNRWET